MKNKDLFRDTRRQLSVMNSFMLIVFLLVFIIVTFGVLTYIIYNEQKIELHALTNQEIGEYAMGNKSDTNIGQTTAGSGIYLNYFLQANGELLVSDEFAPDLRQTILGQVREWTPDCFSVQYKSFLLPGDQELHVLLAAQNVFENGNRAGTIYIGKDITFLWKMFKWFLAVLLGMSLLFVVVAVFVGPFMTKRAMKPILHSYQLQREFVADASHELRTPISILNTGLKVIELEEGDKISPFSYQLLKDLQKETKSVTKLVSDLLLLARSDSGAQQLQMEWFDFLELASQVVRSLEGMATSKQITLTLDTQEPLQVYADQEKLKQLLYILVDNAIKYSGEKGSVKLSYARSEADHKQKLRLTVEDTGIGIEPAQFGRIFDRFYRADKNRSRETGGTGLGLAIAKWIVEAHRGTIHASSEPGVGTVFTVLFPLQKGK